MKKFIVLFAIFLSFSLVSGTPEKTVTLTLTETEVVYVLTTLSKEPKKDVDGIYNKIYNQAIEQLSDSTKPKSKKQ